MAFIYAALDLDPLRLHLHHRAYWFFPVLVILVLLLVYWALSDRRSS